MIWQQSSSDILQRDEYKHLYDGLSTAADVEAFQSEGYDRRLLETLLNQKVTRFVRKKAYLFQKEGMKMYSAWNAGRSFMDIAESYGLPPMLVAKCIFEKNGTPRKTFWAYVNDPSLLYSEETAAELAEARDNDLVYSPAADLRDRERGKWGEDNLWTWLNAQGIKYTTEADRRNEGRKTPDCLLEEPMMYEGRKIYWIESKASFGDDFEIGYNFKNQLQPYTELFGPGVVVYWTGFVEDIEDYDDVLIEDISILEKKLEKCQD